MLADTTEAACRTLENPSVQRLDKFISTLINAKINAHQLENCNLTFNELTIIHNVFVQILAGYYHSRIKYPDQKDPDANLSTLGEKTLNEATGNIAPQQDSLAAKRAAAEAFSNDERSEIRNKKNKGKNKWAIL